MTRSTWLEAGQELLREGGLSAVKLGALTASTGLTTGSFYHHFDGMPDYLESLAQFYGVEQVDEFLAGIADLEPRERLSRLSEIAEDERMRPLDAAMRAWARSNEAAAEAVATADATLLRFAARALQDLGHSRTESRTRSLVLLSLGTAQVKSPWKLPRSAAIRMREIAIGDPERS